MDCGVCSHSRFELLWDLPKLPLTEKYGEYYPDKCPPIDQQLLICTHCGHVQLAKRVSSALLYTAQEYSYRTHTSKTAREGVSFFCRFFSQVSKKESYRCLLDIGGNDLYLAGLSKQNASRRYVVDPICASQDGQTVEGVNVIGKFIENVDLQRETEAPDLIFCRHVLEHIAEPKQLFLKLFRECSPEALYFFEIPCLENLVEANRFDAIFHQHYHYFDLLSFQRLLQESGGEYLAHIYNRQGPCGGALLVAFRKNRLLSKIEPTPIDEKRENIGKAIASYRQQMDLLSTQLHKFSNQIYGYGASLMLATLAYHLRSDLSPLICILDDDDSKHNLSYQNIPVTIQSTKKITLEKGQNYLITSLENTRTLAKKIADELEPRRILLPCVI